MSRPSYLPNLLSSLRIALAPALLAAAYSNSRVGFAIILAVAVISDELDGFFARRWHAESKLGKRLDHWGDGLTMTLAAASAALLWPDIASREWIWVALILAGYLAIGWQRWLEPAQVARSPAWWTRVIGLLVPLSLLPLVMNWTPWPFHVAAVLHGLAAAWRILGDRAESEPGRDRLAPWRRLRATGR